jgi:predicted RNA-binding protein with RPS1 domain
VHLAETHPDQPQGETAAEREAREREEARQAAVAAEIARSEAEAARRKAEARARREAVEGPQGVVAWPQRAKGISNAKPAAEHSERERPAAAPTPGNPTSAAGVPNASTPGPDPSPAGGNDKARGRIPDALPARPADDAWERIRRAIADRTVLTGIVRSRKPFGTFVAIEGIEGLVRSREIPGDATDLHVGQAVRVVVIGIREDEHRVELSMRRAQPLQAPSKAQSTSGMAARPPEGPMALAFRLAREKQKRSE